MKLFEKLNNLRKNKKGFTLVELIVVIIILAILAAILIPSFLGYVNKAQDSKKHVQARAVYLSANTVLAEAKYDGTSLADLSESDVNTPAANSVAEKIKKLVGDDAKDLKYTIKFTIADDQVTKIVVEYTLTDGKIETTPK